MYPGAAGAIVRKEKPKREGKANFGQERKVLLTQLEDSARAQGKNETRLQSLLEQLPNDLPTLTQSWKDLQRDLGMGLTPGTSSSRRSATSSAIKELKKHSPSKESKKGKLRKSRDSSRSPHRPRTQNLSLDEVIARANQRDEEDRRSVDSSGDRHSRRALREKLSGDRHSGTGSGSRVSWASSPRQSLSPGHSMSPGLSLDEGIDEGDETAQEEEDMGQPVAVYPASREGGKAKEEAATWDGPGQEAVQQQVVTVIPYGDRGEAEEGKEDVSAAVAVQSEGAASKAVSAVQLEGWVRELEDWEEELEEKERELRRHRRQLMDQEAGMEGRAQVLLDRELALDEAYAELEVREGEILRQLSQLDQARREQGSGSGYMRTVKTTRSSNLNLKKNGAGLSYNGRDTGHWAGHVPIRSYYASDRDRDWHNNHRDRHGELNVIRAENLSLIRDGHGHVPMGHSDLLNLGHQPEAQPRSYSQSPSKSKLHRPTATQTQTQADQFGPGPVRQLDFRRPGPGPGGQGHGASHGGAEDVKLTATRSYWVGAEEEAHVTRNRTPQAHVTAHAASLSPPVHVRLPDTDITISVAAARDPQLERPAAPAREEAREEAREVQREPARKEAHGSGYLDESRSGGRIVLAHAQPEGDAAGAGGPGGGDGSREERSRESEPARSPRTALYLEQLRQILLDGDKLAAFSRYLGHGANNVHKNVLLLCVDVEAFSYLADEEELSLYAHDIFNQYLKETARRDVGDLRTHAVLLKQRLAQGDLAPDMYARLQDAALERLVEPFAKYVASSSVSTSSPSTSPTMRGRC